MKIQYLAVIFVVIMVPISLALSTYIQTQVDTIALQTSYKSKLYDATYDAVTALEAMRNPVSIFEPIYSDGGDTIYLYDQIEDKRLRKQDLDVNLAITNAIDNLEQREKYIIDQRYIIGKTQMELAEELGISQAQISRLEKNAITTLKKVLK